MVIERGETVVFSSVGDVDAEFGRRLVHQSVRIALGCTRRIEILHGGRRHLYAYRARKRLVKIDFNPVGGDHPGVRSSSEPYAPRHPGILLAGSVRELLSATWGLAETGAAGPTGNSYGDDAGHTCVAVTGPVTDVRTLETASSDREANMWAFTDEALELIAFIECLKRAP